MLICTLETFFTIGFFSYLAGLLTPFLLIGAAKAWRKRNGKA